MLIVIMGNSIFTFFFLIGATRLKRQIVILSFYFEKSSNLFFVDVSASSDYQKKIIFFEKTCDIDWDFHWKMSHGTRSDWKKSENANTWLGDRSTMHEIVFFLNCFFTSIQIALV